MPLLRLLLSPVGFVRLVERRPSFVADRYGRILEAEQIGCWADASIGLRRGATECGPVALGPTEGRRDAPHQWPVSNDVARGSHRNRPGNAAISERVVSRYPAERAAIRRPAGPARVADGSDEQDADGGESERLERIIPAEWPAGDAVQSATCASRRSDSGIRTDQPPAGRE